MNPVKALKIVGATIGTIILGALGSGLWEAVISPSLSMLSSSIAQWMASISTSYEESIFQLAAAGESEMRVYRLQLVVGVLFCMLCFVAPTLSFWRRILDRSRIQKIIFLVLIAAGAMNLAFRIPFVDTAREIRDYSMTSLEILRPHIGEEKYVLLRSDFMQIRNKRDFMEFQQQLETHRKDSGVWLPESPEI